MNRNFVAARDGVALTDLTDDDSATLDRVDDGAYDVDPDARPAPQMGGAESHRLAVVDATTGVVLGAVSWHAVGYGPTAGCAAWNVGIGLTPAARGGGGTLR